MMKIAFATLVLAAAALPVAAQTTAKQLAEWCGPLRSVEAEDGRVKVPQSFGAGYCLGVFDSLRFEALARGSDRTAPAPYCLPRGTNALVMIRAFLGYLESNPGEANINPHAVARRALIRTWPCRTQQL
jgi:hypothetical protein